MQIADQSAVVAKVRAKYPKYAPPVVPMLVEIAQAIGQGAGLLRKDTGNRTPYGDISIAKDIIAFPDGHHFDVFIDVEYEAGATWQDKGYVNFERYVSVDGHSVPTPPDDPPPPPPPEDGGDPGTPPEEPGADGGPPPYHAKYRSSNIVAGRVIHEMRKQLTEIRTGRENEGGAPMSPGYVAGVRQAVSNIAAIVSDFAIDKAKEGGASRPVNESEQQDLEATLDTYTRRRVVNKDE